MWFRPLFLLLLTSTVLCIEDSVVTLLDLNDPSCGVCAAVVDPVCGEDGRTYQNECVAICAEVPVKYHGSCSEGPCDENRSCDYDPCKYTECPGAPNAYCTLSSCHRCVAEFHNEEGEVVSCAFPPPSPSRSPRPRPVRCNPKKFCKSRKDCCGESCCYCKGKKYGIRRSRKPGVCARNGVCHCPPSFG